MTFLLLDRDLQLLPWLLSMDHPLEGLQKAKREDSIHEFHFLLAGEGPSKR